MIRQTAVTLALLMCGVSSTYAADDPSAIQHLSLNGRVFVDTTTTYDPNYGLLRIGIVSKDNVVTYLPPNKEVRKHLPVPLNTRNFTVYTAHSEEGKKGSVEIPIIGSASAGEKQVVYAQMVDVAEVTANDKDSSLSACKIWSLVPSALVEPESTIMFTIHAQLTRVSHGTANQAKADVTASVGTYFSAGVSTYQEENTNTTVPLIAVDGFKFLVKDPKNFCKGSVSATHIEMVRFKTESDLIGSAGALNYKR